ncbi:MAG TPA: hypothetical protein VFG54_00425 [Prolixibacteraceae bacterium]|nr:hypothetical protein [Prolixibacteraceae bacterium]
MNDKTKDLHDKILKGLDLTFERLLKSKQKEDGEFIVSEKGEIVRIKAKEMKHQ